jgi:hypothetical protein
MIIKPSTRKGKRFMAIFKNGRITHFGSRGSSFIDHGDEVKRKNYIARHKVNEDFLNPYSASSLSRYLLWGDSKSLDVNYQTYMKKFDKIINK